MHDELLSISLYPRRISLITGKEAPSPRKIYELAVTGLIPAQYLRGRWYFNDGDEVVAAQVLGKQLDQ